MIIDLSYFVVFRSFWSRKLEEWGKRELSETPLGGELFILPFFKSRGHEPRVTQNHRFLNQDIFTSLHDAEQNLKY